MSWPPATSWSDVLKTLLYNPTPQIVAAGVVILLVAMPIGASLWMVHEFTLASQRIESSVMDLVYEVRLWMALKPP